MIIDKLITFETAKLANELGYRVRHPFGFITKFYRPSTGTMLSYGRTGPTPISMLFYASTQTSLHAWLRENHSLHVQVSPVGGFAFEWYVYIIDGRTRVSEIKFENFKKYEDALEAGLLLALELIKNNKK